MARPLRVLELYAGIGGLAAALGSAAEIVAAVDINGGALEVYGHNFGHRRITALLESLRADELGDLGADLWWASPPCQPFTRRGQRLDLADPRAKTFKVFVERLEAVRPRYVALENVVGFERSDARQLLVAALERSGYLHSMWEEVICPSDFGWPNRRPRYYLVASRRGAFRDRTTPPPRRRSLASLLDQSADPEASSSGNPDLELDPEVLVRYRHAIEILDRDDPAAMTACFTSAYGRSPVRSGSYVKTAIGARYFTPLEILGLLGFPETYRLPAWAAGPGNGRKKAWRLVGNSLSLPAVRHALSWFPELPLGIEGW
ncbi:MAG: DNA cytosine methyltransferase [Acidobacteriota bacterium]